jgi:hypothetical protein
MLFRLMPTRKNDTITHRQEDTVARHYLYILMSGEEYFDIIQKPKRAGCVPAPHNTPILCTSSHFEARFIGEMSINDSKHSVRLREYFPMTLNKYSTSTYVSVLKAANDREKIYVLHYRGQLISSLFFIFVLETSHCTQFYSKSPFWNQFKGFKSEILVEKRFAYATTFFSIELIRF